MHRNYEYRSSSYYGGPSNDSMDEYLERITRMQRTPPTISHFPRFPNAYDALNNNSMYEEKHDDNAKNISHMKHHVPEVHKKVHFVEREKTAEVDRDGKREVYEDKTVDVEADGFIQQKHKNFELCKWDTFKAY